MNLLIISIAELHGGSEFNSSAIRSPNWFYFQFSCALSHISTFRSSLTGMWKWLETWPGL